MRFLLSFWRLLPFADRFTSPRAAKWGAVQTFAATVAFGALHSFLCLPATKRGARKLVGERYGRGFYRLFFMLQSLVTTGALAVFILSRPHKVLYRATKSARLVHWAVQFGAIIVALWGVKELRFRRFSGLEGASDAVLDKPEIAEPETQSPDGGDGLDYERGPFKWSRHAIEWIILVVLWATPILKTNWLGFNIASTIYMVFGVLQEEKRLAAKGGTKWQRYCSRVGMVFGRK